MARSLFKKLADNVSGTVAAFCTTFSGDASLISPDAGKYLALYSFKCSSTQSTAVAINDGTVCLLDEQQLGPNNWATEHFAGYHLRFDTAIRITRPSSQNHAITINLIYRQETI